MGGPIIRIRGGSTSVGSRVNLWTRNAQDIAVTPPTNSGRVIGACVCRAPGSDREEDALLLNALTSVVTKARVAPSWVLQSL